MLKRILSVLLCAALLLGGTALAAKEDDYTLPELLYQQFAVQDYPIRGSVAVTASGTASWLDFLLPLTASTLHVRLLNLEDSDDFQYQVFSQDDSGSQQGLTQLYRVGDTLYLRTDVLPDVLLSMPLAESAKSNPSFYSVLAEMMAQPDILWESMWQPALEEYLNELELWLADYAAEPDTMTENGELVMRVSYVIPADDVKEQTKLMWKQALYDETLLTLLRPMMTGSSRRPTSIPRWATSTMPALTPCRCRAICACHASSPRGAIHCPWRWRCPCRRMRGATRR